MVELRRSLLRWFARNGRSFPWRQNVSWFHLLVAETMLRRTRADQVLPVYRQFVRLYPSPDRAGQLDAGKLAEIFRPLGLNWRARQFARTLAFLRDSSVVRGLTRADEGQVARWQAVPGVGSYSEAMILSMLWNWRRPAIDSNVVRIFYRMAGRAFRPDYRRRQELIRTAAAFVNSPRAGRINLALVDLGALVCRPRQPDCAACPLGAHCNFYRFSSQHSQE